MAGNNGRPRGKGLSLYASLLGEPQTAAESGLPTQDSPEVADASKKQPHVGALRFQPTKRPQQSKAKSTRPVAASATVRNQAVGVPKPSLGSLALKSTIEDWKSQNDDFDDAFFDQPQRQRGGKKEKRRRANQQRASSPMAINWDDIYDPFRPVPYREYKQSSEREADVWEWRAFINPLARLLHRDRSESDWSDEEDTGRAQGMDNPDNLYLTHAGRLSLDFAPPRDLYTQNEDSNKPENEESSYLPLVPPRASAVVDDATGEDAFARRMKLSGLAPPVNSNHESGQLEHVQSKSADTDGRRAIAGSLTDQNRGSTSVPLPSSPSPPPPSLPTSHPPAIERASNFTPATTIARAPIRYDLPPPPPQDEADDEFDYDHDDSPPETESQNDDNPEASEAPRSKRPGQRGFAERFMAKHGWRQGTGLGASSSGIINPLSVTLEKRKRKSDAEGGGYDGGRGGRGKIVGGKRAKTGNDDNNEEPPGEVVVLAGLVSGGSQETDRDPDIIQALGDQCSTKYGNVERIFIHRRGSQADRPLTFIKFTSPVSALRAVQALHGSTLNDTVIEAAYYNPEKFNQGIFG